MHITFAVLLFYRDLQLTGMEVLVDEVLFLSSVGLQEWKSSSGAQMSEMCTGWCRCFKSTFPSMYSWATNLGSGTMSSRLPRPGEFGNLAIESPFGGGGRVQ